jgi:hypothetical protein
LDAFIDEARSPIVNFQGIPGDGVANILELGDVFESGGTLKIIRKDDIHAGSTSGVGGVGTVEVEID